jgi:hypothetical protein
LLQVPLAFLALTLLILLLVTIQVCLDHSHPLLVYSISRTNLIVADLLLLARPITALILSVLQGYYQDQLILQLLVRLP